MGATRLQEMISRWTPWLDDRQDPQKTRERRVLCLSSESNDMVDSMSDHVSTFSVRDKLDNPPGRYPACLGALRHVHRLERDHDLGGQQGSIDCSFAGPIFPSEFSAAR